MASTVLIVTMGVDHVAPARMPRELQRAGLRVGVLAPDNALALHTAHVDFRGRFASGATLYEWTRAIDAAVRALDPALILPGDDLTVRTLLQLVLEPPPELVPLLDGGLGALVRASLGDARQCLAAIDKAQLFLHAIDSGIPVADGGVAADAADALEIAARVGYPVVVRRDFGSGGAGTVRCRAAGDVLAAMSGASAQSAWTPPGAPRFVVQRFSEGEVVTRPFVAWQGAEIAGFTRSRLATHPGPFGPGSVVEFAGIPAVAAATRTLAAGLGIHGFAGAQFLLEPGSGKPLLVEINRRMLPATHSGSRIGIDLADALAVTMRGERWNGSSDLPEGPGLRLALFPQEWYRKPSSSWLRDLPCDLPWHDPSLVAAMTRAVLHAADVATAPQA